MHNINAARDKQILHQYAENVDIDILCSTHSLSRVSIYNVLKKYGVKPTRKSESPVTHAICRYCEREFETPTSQPCKYCSVRCFHKARSFANDTPGALARVYGRLARKELERCGIVLKEGEVVHHKDGDKSNNYIDNLQVFSSHSEHMKFHHALTK